MLTLLILTLLRDDAWICLLAEVIGLLLYFIIMKPKWQFWAAGAAWFVAAYLFANQIFNLLISLVYKILKNDMEPGLIAVMQREERFSSQVKVQVSNANAGHGSMFMRLSLYGESLRGMFRETYGLGFGPSGVEKYLQNEEPQLIPNPHSFWIELLSNYGVIISAAFLVICLYIFVRLIKLFLRSNNEKYLVLIAMDAIFVIANNAPSDFIAFSYYWVPIAISYYLVISSKSRSAGYSSYKGYAGPIS